MNNEADERYNLPNLEELGKSSIFNFLPVSSIHPLSLWLYHHHKMFLLIAVMLLMNWTFSSVQFNCLSYLSRLLLLGYYLTTSSLLLHSTTMLMTQFCWLGFDTDGLMPAVWKGGETEALTRLERHLERKVLVSSQIGQTKMTSQSLLASQTGISPYLRFGCLSVRLFHQQLTSMYKKVMIILRHPFATPIPLFLCFLICVIMKILVKFHLIWS